MACAFSLEVARIKASSSAIVGPNARVAEGEQVIPTAPAELLFATPEATDLDTYSLGRMVASEWASGPPAALLALAEVARNTARARGVTVTELLVNEEKGGLPVAGQDGFYGRQSGRWAATSLPPTERTLLAADLALRKKTGIAGGATKFYHPRTSDKGLQAGKVIKDALAIYDAWSSEGFRFVSRAPLYLDYCIDPYDFFLMGRSGFAVGTASVDQGRRLLENARRA